MKKFIVFIPLFILFVSSQGQNLSNIIKKNIIIGKDTLKIDTLSIVPGTFSLFYNDSLIIQNEYKLNYAKSLLIFNSNNFNKYKNKIFSVSYRIFPINFSQSFYHKKSIIEDNILHRRFKKNINNNYTTSSGNLKILNTSGSISRGISFGNNQNASLKSDFNLQISGNISPEIKISANITDNNLPIQADGNSQNLREFDKVFIQLKSKNSSLIAGDFVLNSGNGYFMKFSKKVKGVDFITKFNTSKFNVKTGFNASVAKGNYNKMFFSGVEGNQGPYRLNGKNGEQYIVILSGSEKIYLDGILLKRGNENDYIINYNTAELTFTTKRIITKDSRIIAEFEYSQQNYVRFAYGSQTTFSNDKNTFFFNLFSEQDAKNSTITQDLNDEQKLMFQNIGDNINSAFTQNITQIDTFNRNEILYRKTDTIVNGNIYTDVYVYSTDSLSAKYRAIFSFVGANKGNYIRELNGVNGKIFKWVAPINNISQGEYEPIKLLISPKKKQMISTGADGKIGKKSSYHIETALSNNDINTFSPKDDNNNIGFALKTGFDINFLKKDTSDSYLIFKNNYQFENKNFNAFEPYKSPEFNRDLNLKQTNVIFDEHFASSEITYFNKKFGKTGFKTDFLNQNTYYTGNRNTVFLNIRRNKFSVDINANRLTTKDTSKHTEFIRYNSKIEKQFDFIRLGIINSGEQNLFRPLSTDSLETDSYRYNEFETYLKTPEKSIHLLTLSYLNREDFLPVRDNLNYISGSHNIKFFGNILKSENQTLSLRLNYRSLSVKDTSISHSNSENKIAGKADYSFHLFNRAVSNSFSAEHMSGNESVKEYTYLEVQSGQGIFTWKDFNHNNIKELNEFVPANFSDEAQYIRISLPSSEYKTIYNQSVYENFIFRPKNLFHGKTIFTKIISIFSNRFTYKMNRKILPVSNYYQLNLTDSSILSQNTSLKNQAEFHFKKQKLYLIYIYQNTEIKNLLINGIDFRKSEYHSFEIKKQLKSFHFQNNFKSDNKIFSSEFFSENDYNINSLKNETFLTYKIDKNSQLKGSIISENKTNTSGSEKLQSYSAGAEYQFSSADKGQFQINFDFIKNNYKGETGSAISYEILNGLQNGINYLWSVRYTKNISKNLRAEISYNGRKTGENKIIHTGGISLRAYF